MLKYGNRPSYGIDLGMLCGRGMQSLFQRREVPDCIVPIPLHRTRFLERGYNQSNTLARGIGKIITVPVLDNLLIRSRATRTQTGLNTRERQDNVAAAFSIGLPNEAVGKHVLLVDDVLTTGATLCAAAEVLHEAGVQKISFATLAFARP